MTLLIQCDQCRRLTPADTAHLDTQRRALCPDCAAARDILLAWAIARLDVDDAPHTHHWTQDAGDDRTCAWLCHDCGASQLLPLGHRPDDQIPF